MTRQIVMTSRADRAEANIPFAGARGRALDAEITRQVKRQAVEERHEMRATAAAQRALTKKALAMVGAMPAERLAELGRPHKLTAAQTRQQFEIMARSHNASALIRSLENS